MNITGIEVIRRNPGEGIAVIPVSALPGEKVELTYGDILRVNVTFDYRGPATEVTLYGAIGVRGIGFDEKCPGTAPPFPLDQSVDWTPTTLTVDIPITEDIDPGTDYDLYCKLLEYPGAGMPEIDDVIDIVGIPPDYVLIQDTIYPLAYIYEGTAETCIFEFPLGPEQIPFTQWGGIKIAEAMASHVEEQGSRVLELKIYEDTTPALWTNYRVEVTAAVKSQGIAVWPVLAVLPWAFIIKGTLIVTGIIIVGWIIQNLIKAVDKAFFHTTPGLEDIKPTWSRETLTKTINDTEDFLEYPLTPPEELEAMSDEDLRHYLNALGEAVVPPVPDMWPLLLLGGLGVLGLGGIAAAYAMTKPTGK